MDEPAALTNSSITTNAVVLIMGAFATRRHFDELADFLASKGCAVLSYDHRGIGKSTCSIPSETQTSVMLANDCVALCDHVFGRAASVHVYGASMGGCIAQHVALTFLRISRLKSLYLAVTTRGNCHSRNGYGSFWYRI